MGETHKEVVNVLKELPMVVYMVCCRSAAMPLSDSQTGQSEPEDVVTESTEKVQTTFAFDLKKKKMFMDKVLIVYVF